MGWFHTRTTGGAQVDAQLIQGQPTAIALEATGQHIRTDSPEAAHKAPCEPSPQSFLLVHPSGCDVKGGIANQGNGRRREHLLQGRSGPWNIGMLRGLFPTRPPSWRMNLELCAEHCFGPRHADMHSAS